MEPGPVHRSPGEQCTPIVHGSMAYGQKSFKLLWPDHQVLSGFLANDHLLSGMPVSCQLMIRVIIRLYRRICTDFLEFTQQLRKPQKTSARRPSIKAIRPVIASNGAPFLQMRSVGPHSTSAKEK